MKFPEFLLDLFFPARCALCGKVVPHTGELCSSCEEKTIPVHTCKRINVPATGETILCMVPYLYKDEIRRCILQFKFYGQTENARFLGRVIADEVKRQLPICRLDVVTAVPISKQRKNERGYNQSELIAREISAAAKLPYWETLEKKRDNLEQHSLRRNDRRKNVKGAYTAIHLDQIKGKHILLVDDIVTTGYTLSECAAMLFQAGAAKVFCTAAALVDF